MEMYMDDKWKLSKKGSRSGGGRRLVVAPTVGGENGGPIGPHTGSMSLKKRKLGGRPTRSVTGQLAGLVKEQRARFYIMRRCITMLVCWRDYP